MAEVLSAKRASLRRANALSVSSMSLVPLSHSLSVSATLVPDRRSLVSVQHYDSLICELRCPGCAKPLQGTRLCTNGHSLCQLCADLLIKCPICQEQITNTRSVTLEALAAKAYFNCKNNRRGCTVRLPCELMGWHEKHCGYQLGTCFMGLVWSDCSWKGREIDWLSHCLDQHAERVWNTAEVTTSWCPRTERQSEAGPVIGYHLFRVFNETFNVYQIREKRDLTKMTWTVIAASNDQSITNRFAFEIELFVPNDPTRLCLMRNVCHAERDEDILNEGRSVIISMATILRMMDKEKVLNYRVRIIEINNLNDSQSLVPTAYANSDVESVTSETVADESANVDNHTSETSPLLASENEPSALIMNRANSIPKPPRKLDNATSLADDSIEMNEIVPTKKNDDDDNWVVIKPSSSTLPEKGPPLTSKEPTTASTVIEFAKENMHGTDSAT